jgi:hypothetical protein
MPTRTYTLFTTGSGFITNQTGHYRSSMWAVQVRAQSIRQAYFLLAHRIWANQPSSVGIVSSEGPSDDITQPLP